MLKNNGLSIVLLVLFVGTLVGFIFSGYADINDERQQKDEPPLSMTEYLTGGEFSEQLFVNWESEFLQQFAYVVLTIFLFQKGSSESKKIDEPDPADERPAAHRNDPNAPWPVRRGGLSLTLFQNSLSLVFITLFVIAFLLHGLSGMNALNTERALQGQAGISFLQFLGTAHFWSQSFQNWQSEFLSVFAIVVLGIFLRQYGSPESKPVHSPNHQTGH